MIKRSVYIAGVIYALVMAKAMAFPIAGADHQDNQPVEITANTLEVEQEKRMATFSGNVEAIQGEIVLRADKMLVFYREKKEGAQNSVSKIETKGNVFLATPKESAQGKEGIYDVDKRQITLSGNVMLSSGKSVVKGENLVYDLQSGESRIISSGADSATGSKGRVRGVFVPEGAE